MYSLAKERRLIYPNWLNDGLNERIANGTDKPSIRGNVLKDPYAKLNELGLLSVSMTMVGPNVPPISQVESDLARSLMALIRWQTLSHGWSAC